MPPNSGLVLSGNLDADLVSIALDMADEQLRKPQGLRFHSDPGSQYRSRYFHKRLWRHRISQRMNRRGNCYETRGDSLPESEALSRRPLQKHRKSWPAT